MVVATTVPMTLPSSIYEPPPTSHSHGTRERAPQKGKLLEDVLWGSRPGWLGGWQCRCRGAVQPFASSGPAAVDSGANSVAASKFSNISSWNSGITTRATRTAGFEEELDREIDGGLDIGDGAGEDAVGLAAETVGELDLDQLDLGPFDARGRRRRSSRRRSGSRRPREHRR